MLAQPNNRRRTNHPRSLLSPAPAPPPPLQVQEAVDRLLASAPVHSAVEAAKPSVNAVSGAACAACTWQGRAGVPAVH